MGALSGGFRVSGVKRISSKDSGSDDGVNGGGLSLDGWPGGVEDLDSSKTRVEGIPALEGATGTGLIVV